MIRSARVGIVVALAAFAPGAFAGNVIANPDFSHWLADWRAPDDPIGGFGADTDNGSPAPPSAEILGDENGGESELRSACAAIDASTNIDFSFETRVVAGTAVGAVAGYSDEACTQSTGSLATDTISSSPDWQKISRSDLALPSSTRFVQFVFHVQPAGEGPIGDAYLDHVAVGPTGTLPAAIPIDQPGLTGAWYDPNKSGQGLQITITPADGVLFGAWFTYDTEPGGTETQRWYSLQASLASDDVSADVTIYRNTGGAFDGPPATSAVPVGTGTIAFDSCTSGTFAYTMDDGREGSIRVRTLLPPLPQLYCDEYGHGSTDPNFYWLSGTWYDPSHPGQGLMLSVDQYMGSAFVGWYTYAADGSSSEENGQRWFSAQGGIDPTGNTISLIVYESTGGAFDATSPVSTIDVGTATIDFASCDSATFHYTFTSGELAGKSGDIPLTRLAATPESCTLLGAP